MHHAVSATCPNCLTETKGNFCHECSQETTLHPPSAREFLHEFIGHYVALEGKLWQSLWLLLVRPGRLTREYIVGRRVRYVQPLRLYLTFSLIFFALVKFSGVPLFQMDDSDVTVTRPTAGATAPPAAHAASKGPEISRDVVHVASDIAETAHAGWGARATRFLSQNTDVVFGAATKAFFAYGPYALFALMPVFALLLKVLYLGTGRRYGAHLLFALHANAFAFAMLILQLAVPAGYGPVHIALALWMVVYLPLAMRRVYGGGWFATLLRWIVLALLHLICIVLAIALTFSSAALT